MAMDIRTKTFIEQIRARLRQFNIAHQVMESGYNQTNPHLDEPFNCNYQICIYLQNNNLGHQDIYIYLNKDSFSLAAVRTSRTTPTLIDICKKLGMLYGVPFKSITKIAGESDAYYFIF